MSASLLRTVPRRLTEVVLIVLFALAIPACERTRLDENLCPVGSPPKRQTILLIDTSDPLTAKHREVLRRMVSEMQSGKPSDGMAIEPGEALIVYRLGGDEDAVESVLRVCNPGGNPTEWSWRDNLTKGQRLALSKWRKFIQSVEPLFPESEGEPQSRSLILEALGVLIPRHAPSRRQIHSTTDLTTRTHLILYSDLLQHSTALSHYGSYPPADALKSTAGFRHLVTDLTGVEVSLYRLERARDAHWQTVDHYYWWTNLVVELGGQVIWQESI